MLIQRGAGLLLRSLTRLLLIGAVTGIAGLPAQGGETGSQGGQPKYRIGIHNYKPGKIYDEAMEGIHDGLRAEGIAYEEIVLQSNGKSDTAKENLLKLDAMSLDLIYSLSSAGTQIAKDLKLKTPVIATVIGHPRTLGVAGDRSGDADPLTGTSYYVDAKRQLALYRSLFPNIRKVGMIFDAKNPAGFLAEEPLLREACKDSRLDFASTGVSTVDELSGATAQLIEEKVDIIVVPTNNLIYEALAKILTVSDEKKIPVVSMNKQGVEAGALAGLFGDTYYLGRQTGGLARNILVEKKPAGALAFQYIPRPDVILNMKGAKSLDYEFPPDILGEAAIVLQ